MAETQRIRTVGRKPACASNARLEARKARRREMMQERNRTSEKPDGFIHYESSDDEEQFRKDGKQFLKTSFNFADYIKARESDTKEIRKLDQEFAYRRLLSHDLLKEFPIIVENVNKIFCSQWLSSKQIMFGTKCNRLMVYDLTTKKSLQMSRLTGGQNSFRGMLLPTTGIYSIEINPSRTLLATVGGNNRQIEIYKLPTLDGVCVGENGHKDSIYDMCWIDDEYLVSGSRDSKLTLWHVDKELFDASDKEDVLTHRWIQPSAIKECKLSETIRSLVFNRSYKEIVAYSKNSYIHIWSAETLQQKLSRRFPTRQDNPCLAIHDNVLYAVGCQSYILLLDARTLHAVRKIPMRNTNAGVRSTSFLGSILTVGTGCGTVMFYDLKANKYLESSINSSKSIMLKTSKGFVLPEGGFRAGAQHTRHTPAIYTHCYDGSGTKLFCAGGPLTTDLYGNYAGLWQ